MSGAVVEIVVADGLVVGGSERFEIALGDDVVIRVTADVNDEVHVHGYDVVGEVAPSSPAELRFSAAIPGVFEVELERTSLELARLEVS